VNDSYPARSSLGKKRGKQLPLETRIALFPQVRGLRESGLSFAQLQREILERAQVRLSKATISGWVNGVHAPLGRVNRFEAEPSPDLAYIIGVVLGDGNLNVHEWHNEILLSVTDWDFAQEFSRCLSGILYKSRPYKVRWSENRKRWIVQVASIFLHKFLSRRWQRLRPWIEHCKNCKAAFLRAFYDSEGSVSSGVLVSNTSKEVLFFVKDLLRELHIETGKLYVEKIAGTILKDPRTGRLYARKKNCYALRVRAKSVLDFTTTVGFTLRRKQKLLEIGAIRAQTRLHGGPGGI